jgi:aryl-alcohol dehydrogenase-like predicted oxidoreductase
MTKSFFDRTRVPGTELDLPYFTIGTMMFGSRADMDESQRMTDTCLEKGLNFFDTANMYNAGVSEEFLGKAIKGRRHECIIATKVGLGKRDGKREGLSARVIEQAIDESLQRLQTDRVEFYYLHQPDYDVPIEESLEALSKLADAGKILHSGISNYGAYQSLEILDTCEKNGWHKPVITQMIYNPLMRPIELEYTRFCRDYNMFLTVYNPLAGGLLTGKYANLNDEQSGGRFIDNETYKKRYWTQRTFDGMLELQKIAEGAGISLTHLTLAWILQQDCINNILLGPSSTDQLLDCLAAEEALPKAAEVMDQMNEALTEYEGTNATYAR